MSAASTLKMIRAYFQDARPTRFLSGLFQSPRENFFNSEEIEFDIVRGEEDVAVAVQSLAAGYRNNEATQYVNKSFIPPVFKEQVGLDSNQLIKRMPGNTPFADFSYQANIMEHMMRATMKVEDKIRRANELQASQVLQTGTATLIDSAGASVYAIDYQPKATHFPTAGTAWGSGGDIIGDLLSLCNVIRNDGLADPRVSIWGEDAFETALQDSDFLARLDTRRADLGAVTQMAVGGTGGGNYRGTIDLGNFKLDIVTYGGRYKHPQTGTITQYVDPGKVIVMADSIRLDATFGAVPHIGRELGISGQGILPAMPRRFSSQANGVDIFSNVWLSENGEQLFGGVASRPLFIPTAIDQFGCIDSGV